MTTLTNRSVMAAIKSWFVIAPLLIGLAEPAGAQDSTDLSIEDLLKIEVTSVSKKEEHLFEAPSAIYVVTRADIRRAGATTVPEVLRLVPGVSVAQISGSDWAVTARGFNSLRANKLLVLVDGRSVYSAVTSGVDWDIASPPVEEIERIEVIRGPGAALWGANAVNGVVNIVSRDAFDTRGGYAAVHAGTTERGSGFVRFGDEIGPKGHYRIYGKYVDRGSTTAPGRSERAGDDWNVLQSGVRADFRPSRWHAVTLAAQMSEAEIGQQSTIVTGVNATESSSRPTEAHSRSVAINWTHTRSAQSSISLKASFEQNRRTLARFAGKYDMLNVDFQHRLRRLHRHDLVWGFGQRVWRDRENNSYMVSFTPDRDQGRITNAFVHDEIAIRPALNLTVGSKLEHHDEHRFNVQPNVRLAWTPSTTRTLWAAVSQAIREPSRMERSIRVNYATYQRPGSLPIVMSLLGNPEFQPERLRSYEAGYRIELASGLQIDTATFYSRYRDLRYDRPLTFVESAPTPTHLILGSQIENHHTAVAAGVEAFARWQLRPWWKLEGTSSWLRAKYGNDGYEADDALNATTPAHQWRVGTGIDLPRSLRLDVNTYHTSSLDAFDVDAYTRLDLRLNHEVTPSISLAVIGQNLLRRRHLEFGDSEGARAGEIPRSAYLRLTWRF